MTLSHPAIRYCIAAIWLVNGLICKVLGWAPRHERIVAAILGGDHSTVLTSLIGMGEIVIAVWILSGWRYRWCAVVQIALIVTMNTIEFFAAPDLLLWGRLNIVFAFGLVVVIYFNEFRRSAH